MDFVKKWINCDDRIKGLHHECFPKSVPKFPEKLFFSEHFWAITFAIVSKISICVKFWNEFSDAAALRDIAM